jgi:hypothetical protein
MKPLVSRNCRSTLALVLAVVAGGGLPATTGAQRSPSSCIAPDVVGVQLAMARHALEASGCTVQARQLPAHGQFVTPAGPEAQQLVAAQSPRPGSRTGQVTISLKPLCAQPAEPGPDVRGPISSRGPSELVAGLFLQGGPVRTAAHCRHGTSVAGTLTVSAPDGRLVAHRTVRAGRFAVFPLKPGRYTLLGSVAVPGGPVPQPEQVTIARSRTTRLNLVAAAG